MNTKYTVSIGRSSREHPEKNQSADLSFKKREGFQVVGNTKFESGFLNFAMQKEKQGWHVEARHPGMAARMSKGTSLKGNRGVGPDKESLVE